MSKPNPDNEEFFLDLVRDGSITVSNDGVVINTKTGNRIGKNSNQHGYCAIGWRIAGTKKVRHILVHRLVFLLYGDGFSADKPFVNHKDGNKRNNHIDNLEAISNRDNIIHFFESGNKARVTEKSLLARSNQRGAKNHAAKMTINDVLLVITLSKTTDLNQRAIAEKMNVSRSIIGHILNRRKYKDVWEKIDNGELVIDV